MNNDKQHVRLHVVGPVQVGKSIVLARIKQVLQEEFGITVAADAEVSRYSETKGLIASLAQWERQMIRGCGWTLTEGNSEATLAGSAKYLPVLPSHQFCLNNGVQSAGYTEAQMHEYALAAIDKCHKGGIIG